MQIRKTIVDSSSDKRLLLSKTPKPKDTLISVIFGAHPTLSTIDHLFRSRDPPPHAGVTSIDSMNFPMNLFFSGNVKEEFECIFCKAVEFCTGDELNEKPKNGSSDDVRWQPPKVENSS
ncbi:hypothetical protein TorRG33x02_130010 [Trema orientale]|uniref:Uncharacterized protein n=1 Tax=Trema orientale TaxID=63057 RepID=A0A2P5F088_TREOI|nr:hypothetical protein TorRG33x02_130010 [Trema orientale]